MIENMSAKKKTAAADTSTAVVRLPTTLLDRAAATAEALSRRMGVEVSRAAVLESALAKGLDALDPDGKRSK